MSKVQKAIMANIKKSKNQAKLHHHYIEQMGRQLSMSLADIRKNDGNHNYIE